MNIKNTHKVIKDYFKSIKQYDLHNVTNEVAVTNPFQNLLSYYSNQNKWICIPQYSIKKKDKTIRPDAVFKDSFKMLMGMWEAKRESKKSDFEKEIQDKFKIGYPKDNIIFQHPGRAIIYQSGKQIFDEDISKEKYLIEAVKTFFEYRPPHYENWESAVLEFKSEIPQIASNLLDLIQEALQSNNNFINAFNQFIELCKNSINPNISQAAVKEMIVQHLLTERVFRKIFNHSNFREKNPIANEIEKLIKSLTSKHFSRDSFLETLDRFYHAIELAASNIQDFSQKQGFLNTVYEKFFQGFSVKIADTHGIMYTPQPIVNFMVKGVDTLIKKHFEGKSLSDKDIKIIDPFVGTGNFIVNILQHLKKTSLEYKYANDLYCNEMMLLPYYIANINIEYEYMQMAGKYTPFQGISFVDSFELAQAKEHPLFIEENTQRVEKQKNESFFVIIGNPPYNKTQSYENDNNKNKKYSIIDQLVKETYSKDSKSILKNALSDPYVKAIRLASDRIGKEGIVCFVTNNSFIHSFAFDGMRKHLANDFSHIYLIDLEGNLFKNQKNNVFGIKPGVSINIFIKKKNINTNKNTNNSSCEIFYSKSNSDWSKEEKLDFLDKQTIETIAWEKIIPDKKYFWMNDGYREDFNQFLQLINRKDKQSNLDNPSSIFKLFSLGIATNRDKWCYNFNTYSLSGNMKRTIAVYNSERIRWHSQDKKKDKANVDNFVIYDDKVLKWSNTLKKDLLQNKKGEFQENKIRDSIYRPFTKKKLFFDHLLNDRQCRNPEIFPSIESEKENRVIGFSGFGSENPFFILMLNKIPCLPLYGFGKPTQCLPYYRYDKDGTNRKDNITDWALESFQKHYKNTKITKWDIFYYIYAIFHCPEYKNNYKVNLKREFPRIPFMNDFHIFKNAGEELGEIHVNYELQDEYPLELVENPNEKLDWKVEKMKLSKCKSKIIYNNFLSLSGLPQEVFNYRLGNFSAIEWMINQYQVKIDKRSEIIDNPNRKDDPEYIVRLIRKIVTVSLKTLDIVKKLSENYKVFS